MIKTIVSILISLGLIIGLSVYELYYVNDTFSFFKQAVLSLYDKTEAGQATYEDGTAVQLFWVSAIFFSSSFPSSTIMTGKDVCKF